MTTKQKLQLKQYYEQYLFTDAADYLFSLRKTCNDDPILEYNLAYSLYCSAQYSRSLAVMNRILKTHTNDYQILLLAARIYLKSHYYDRAEKLLLFIVSGSSAATEALALLSVYYFLVGDDSRSLIFRDKARISDPESPGYIVADARLSLYLRNKKYEGDALDMTLTHTTGERHVTAIKTLYFLLRNNRKDARKLLKNSDLLFPCEVMDAFISLGA